VSGLKPYPVYKPSGVEWLGDVPEHWEVTKYSYYLQSGMGETILSSELLENGTIPVLSATEEYKYFGYVNSSRVHLDKGDLVIPARGNSIGHVKLIIEPCTTTQTTIYSKKILPQKVDTKFIAYALMGGKEVLFHFDRTAIPQITVDQVSANKIPFPGTAEQSSIATFLDRETAHIDSLVEKKTRFIELLKEKRQALITDAVTGKFDVSTGKPYPAYKHSGVEWLGDTPEHWDVLPLKRLASIENGRDYKHVEVESEGYPVIGSGGPFAMASEFLFKGKSVLLGRKGTIDKPLYIDGEFWPVDTMFYTKIDSEADAKFVYYTALTIPFNLYSTNTALPSMTQEDLSSNKASCPGNQEQSAIATFLDRETTRIDDLMGRTKKSIELLKERRSALITAAVTGKIDVRGCIDEKE